MDNDGGYMSPPGGQEWDPSVVMAAAKGLEKRKHDINIERAIAKKMKKPPRGQKFIDISYMRPMEDNPFLLNPLGWGVGFGD